MPEKTRGRVRIAIVAALLAAGFGVQLYFFNRYPQPILFGDPALYYQEGKRLQDAIGQVCHGAPISQVWASLQGTFHFAGAGLVFAGLDALKTYDLAFLRGAFAIFNTIGMLGAFLLGQRLANSYAGGLAALLIAVFHPSFATHTGRLYPDPLTGCLLVWATYFFSVAIETPRTKWMLASGVTLGLAFCVRSQLMLPATFLLLLIAILTAPMWLRSEQARRKTGVLLIGFLPFSLLWFGLTRSGGEIRAKVAEDNFALKQLYPYGFWQFLETDGWEGPYRLKTEPYYKALEAAAHADPDLLRNRTRQIRFTLGYVRARWRESALLVLDNVYRLYDRPANPYQWDYPFPARYQPAYQKAILLLALVGWMMSAAANRARALTVFVPLCFACVHGLTFPWPRYGFPALLTWIGLAGAGAGWIATAWPDLRRRLAQALRGPLALLVMSALLALAARALFLRVPEASRVASLCAVCGFIAGLFALVSALGNTVRHALLATAITMVVCTLVIAHTLRDPLWHTTSLTLNGATPAVEQEITLDARAREDLRRASEAFIVFDMTVPNGVPKELTVRIGDRAFTGAELISTIPRLQEGTATGGRDRRTYRQWWALPFDPALLPVGDSPLRIRLNASSPTAISLRGDRFAYQQSVYEGPSFGDWPYLVAGKLEYDGEYRLSIRRPLESFQTQSFVVTGAGERLLSASVHRIRLITLDSNTAGLSWNSTPVPRAGLVAAVWSAYSGNRGPATLWLDGKPLLTFNLGASQDFEIAALPYRLCFIAEGLRADKPYGTYALIGPALRAGARLDLSVRYASGMSVEPLFYQLDRKRSAAEQQGLLPRCASSRGAVFMPGIEQVIDASRNNYPEDTGRWRVRVIY